jgi:hypothetical protein
MQEAMVSRWTVLPDKSWSGFQGIISSQKKVAIILDGGYLHFRIQDLIFIQLSSNAAAQSALSSMWAPTLAAWQ